MVEYSLEKTKTNGFGWLTGYLKKINISGKDYLGRKYKIPHISWNHAIAPKENKLLKGIQSDAEFYFVHSYYVSETTKNEIYSAINKFT